MKPQNLEIATPYKTVVVSNPNEITTYNGVKVIDGGKVNVDGKSQSLYIKVENGNPEIASKIATWLAAWDAWQQENLPGLKELETAQDAAYNEEHHYHEQFNQMMENENNDGVCPPKPVDQSLRETATALAVEYPRAAAYLRAQGYLQSENINKYSAGKHAMELLVDGGNIEDAENILKNWLPKDID